MLAIGSRGILISREVDPATNQFVWTTALDSHGLSTQVVNAIEINASQIKGDTLSSYDNSTWINLNDGEFNFKDKIKFVNNEFSIMLNNGETIDDFVSQYEIDKENMTNDINDVSQEVTNIKNNIDIVISDGIITEAEIVSIEKSIMQLQKEKVDIDTRYTSMTNNSYLNSELKSELTSSYNNYTKAHRDFVGFIQNIIIDREITEQERVDLDTYSSNYNTALATLKTNMDTCLSNIAENNTAYQINNLKTKIDSDFQDVNNRLDAIMDDVGGVVADGIIEEAEVLIIQNSIKQLNKEKEDVDMIYNTLYNNNDVPTGNKANLKTKYEEYNISHHELINFINTMISDKVATEEEKATFDSLTDTYSTKLATFKNVADIALVMANKNYTDTQFNVLEDRIEMRVTSQEVQTIVAGAVEESKIYSDTLFQGFQEQIDGVIETYYQSTDPSTSWTTNELKAKHTGDIWYDNLNNATYRWSGTGWQKLTDAEAEQAYTLATSKAKVFTSQPTTPYYKGDLWVQGSSGDIMKCIYTRTSGNYSSSDWAKASKYTDDTKANQVASDLANNYYTITETESKIKIASDSITSTVSSNYVNKSTLNNYSTTAQMNSAITQKVNSITSSVSSTYATKNSLGNLESRVNSAEQSITSDAIINKVNTAIGNGKSISTTSTTLSNNAFIVYNGAIYVKNVNGENVLWGDTNGNLQAKGKITTINNNGYLNLEGNKLQGYKSGMSVPMYSCGMWYPNNGSTLSGFVSVSNGNSLIGDSEGCLYMSGWNDSNNVNKKAVLQYSRNQGACTGTVEFYNNGGVSIVSRNNAVNGGYYYGIWNSQEGYVYPYRGDEYFGNSTRPWARAYVKEMYYSSTGYFSAQSANYLLTNVNDDEIETYSVDLNNKPKPKDFVEFVENLEFGIYKNGEDNEEKIQTFAEKETNLNFMPIVDDISTFTLDENPAKSLIIQTVTDRNGENPQQAINLMGYCTTLAITIQELIKENKELKNEIVEIKNRLNNLEK